MPLPPPSHASAAFKPCSFLNEKAERLFVQANYDWRYRDAIYGAAPLGWRFADRVHRFSV
jgi:hypothetical protein